MAITYRQAGVDIDAGDELVERIKPFARATRTANVVADVGGFAGLCRLPEGIEEPALRDQVARGAANQIVRLFRKWHRDDEEQDLQDNVR